MAWRKTVFVRGVADAEKENVYLPLQLPSLYHTAHTHTTTPHTTPQHTLLLPHAFYPTYPCTRTLPHTTTGRTVVGGWVGGWDCCFWVSWFWDSLPLAAAAADRQDLTFSPSSTSPCPPTHTYLPSYSLPAYHLPTYPPHPFPHHHPTPCSAACTPAACTLSLPHLTHTLPPPPPQAFASLCFCACRQHVGAHRGHLLSLSLRCSCSLLSLQAYATCSGISCFSACWRITVPLPHTPSRSYAFCPTLLSYSPTPCLAPPTPPRLPTNFLCSMPFTYAPLPCLFHTFARLPLPLPTRCCHAKQRAWAWRGGEKL